VRTVTAADVQIVLQRTTPKYCRPHASVQSAAADVYDGQDCSSSVVERDGRQHMCTDTKDRVGAFLTGCEAMRTLPAGAAS
jgi:hypothetical protein